MLTNEYTTRSFWTLLRLYLVMKYTALNTSRNNLLATQLQQEIINNECCSLDVFSCHTVIMLSIGDNKLYMKL